MNQPQSPLTSPPPSPGHELLNLDPVPQLLRRVRGELSASFMPSEPLRVSRAPGRLDVMGGIADYTGSTVCELPLDRAAAVALQTRNDRQVQVVSFNLLDENRPFMLQMPLDALAGRDPAALRREFDEPGRHWAGYLLGCLAMLQEAKLVDLRSPAIKGVNLALLSTVALGAGISSSAAIEVATMMNLIDHFAIPRGGAIDGLRIAALCQQVENRVVGAPCGIMDQVTSCCGEAGSLLRMVCQPHELLPPLKLPTGVRVLGINSNVRHSVGGGMYGKTRCAAFMAHRIILEKMREIGQASGRELAGDPMHGYLANLDPEDYKRLFRPALPESMPGREFLARYGGTIDMATTVDPSVDYHVRSAADHHVLEARRVQQFIGYLQEADAAMAGSRERGAALDRAGHLMYASHLSYTNDALLGADECDVLVRLVRERERAGLYGAKITGGGSGGTVAVLCEQSSAADAAVAEILKEYQRQTGREPGAFTGTSPGAWRAGTTLTSA